MAKASSSTRSTNQTPPTLTHQDVIDRMSLAEKAALTSGASFWQTQAIERLDVPSIFVSDGPHGLRKQSSSADHLGLNASVAATCFPTAATLANSWDQQLLYDVGRAVAKEARAEDVAVILGPGLNIKRNPLGGRNFEYFSEDPYLAGMLAAAFIRGAQSAKVGACPKHFAVNSQETYRMSIDEVVDERALNEIYLEGFRIAVQEGKPWMVMTSYNKVNGTYAHENPHLVGDILRDRWGYQGTVVSDWGGNNDAAAALKAGSNLEMPSSNGISPSRVVEAIESGELDPKILDRRIDEILTLLDAARPEAPHPEDDPKVDFASQHHLAQRAAEESLVLLKNDRGSLPLDSSQSVAIIGTFAKTPRYQGAGSSLVNPTQIDSALDALYQSDLNIIGYEPGFKRSDSPSPHLAQRALDLAAKADTVVLFLGLDEGAESEGVDRPHMRLARNQLSLTRKLIDSGARVIVVLAGGAPVELPFADHVEAILHSYLPGQAGGAAIARALTGEVNPSGKLAETYPLRYSDVASAHTFNAHEASAEHRESLYVGYRYFDKIGKPVRFPFGFGLSYTDFSIDQAALVWAEGKATPDAVRVRVTNRGDRAGSETVQVYVEAAESPAQVRAVRELRGFGKVHLEPGESVETVISLHDHAFSIFDVEGKKWQLVGGDYRILVGSSSRNISQTLTMTVEQSPTSAPWQQSLQAEELPDYRSGTVQDVAQAQFERLLGHPLPAQDWDRGAPLDENSILAQLPGHSLGANLVYRTITGTADLLDQVGKPILANYCRFLLALPLRSLSRMTGGSISVAQQDKIIKWLNGK